jgi:hypothetical protein
MADVKRWVNDPTQADAGATTVPASAGTATDAAPARRRPFGLYVVIALLLLNASGAFFDVLRVPVVGGVLATGLEKAGVEALNYVAAAVLVAIAVGLWLLQRWAWVATMLVVGFGLAYGLLLYWQGTPAYWRMGAYMLAVLYLNQGAVQQAFGAVRRPRAALPVAGREERE